ncbi:MAG: hypothetical protein KGJ34_01905 [Patescibacteria group bacterium]|nr:hypothetical protein [Patescibacteria group bacterium]
MYEVTETDTPDFDEEFKRVWRRSGSARNPASFLRQIRAYYEEPHRRYHNLGHIEECLMLFKRRGIYGLAKDPTSVELALIYHDIKYDPGAPHGQNEEESAAMAVRALADTYPEFRESIERLILGTKHEAGLVDNDEQLVADIDIATSFTAPWNKFLAYGAAIREEYRRVVPSDRAFFNGRNEVLQRFLDRPSIFQHPYFQEQYEPLAERNLRRAVQQKFQAA